MAKKGKGEKVRGTWGDDIIVTGETPDHIHAHNGDDDVLAGGGDDKVHGGKGDDYIDGGDGSDHLHGGKGDDEIEGGAGNDRIHGGRGDDQLTGGDGNDRINGGSGDDELSGGRGNDRLEGNSGDDVLDGGAGSDRVKGGSGDDTAIYNASENTDSVDIYDGGSGIDTLQLDLTSEEYARADVQADIQRFLEFLDAHIDPLSGEADGESFTFEAFDLTVRKFELLSVHVDGVEVDPTASNANPIANADSAATDEDMPVVIPAANLILNDNDADGDTLEVTWVGNAINGTVSYDALSGDITFTPGENYAGPAAFDYTVSDGNGGSSTATVTVDVAAVADTPSVSAVNVSADSQNIVSLDISSVLTDTDGSESLSITISGVPANSSLSKGVEVSSGTWALSADDLAGLTLSLPLEVTNEIQLDVTATAIEDSNGDFASSSTTFTVTARPSTGSTIVGDIGIGTLVVDSSVAPTGDTTLAGTIAGGTLTSDGGIVGNQTGSDGTAAVDGGTWNVGADNLVVGNAGTGYLMVSGGGSVTVDNGISNINTYGSGRDLLIGGSPTGVGTMTVTGSGSILTTVGIDNSINVGDGGGTGTLNVENGGEAETMWLQIASEGTGTVNVSGSGSTLIVSPEHGSFSAPYDYEAGWVTLARGTDSDGTLNIVNGGRVEIREGATQNTGGTLPGINVGRDGATGRILVDGAGSVLAITQSAPDDGHGGPLLQLGRGGNGGGTGELTVSNGGEVSLLGESSWMNIGRSEGTGSINLETGGTLNVDGLGSYGGMNLGRGVGASGSISVNGTGSTMNVRGNDVTVNVGREGTGDLTISAGGQVTVENTTVDNTSWNWAGVVIGRGVTGIGTATVTGAGSSLITAGFNGDVRVGREGGSGTLNVLDGATVESIAFVVGRDAGSVGDVTISGAGSTVIVSPEHGNFNEPYGYEAGWMNVGRDGGTGTIRILNGGRLEVRDALNEVPGEETSSEWIDIGRNGSQGSVIIDGAGSVFAITQEGPRPTDAPYDDGPTLRVGNRPGGEGSIDITNDGVLELNGENASLQIGIGWGGDGATGRVNVNSGSRLTLDGQSGYARLQLARGNDDTNSGELHVSGEGSVAEISGASVSIETGFNSAITISDGADLTINGGSTNEDYVTIGAGWGVPDGVGTADLTIDGVGSTLDATVGSLQLGNVGDGMVATMSVTNGAIANITTTRTFDDGWNSIGNGGATGIVNVDGAGSSLTIDAAGTMYIGNGWIDNPGGGEAFVTASKGGNIDISADHWFSIGMIDFNTAFGEGHITATGAGSNITFTNLDLDPNDGYGYAVSLLTESTVTAENGGAITINGGFNDWDSSHESTLTVDSDASMSVSGDLALNNSRMELEIGGTGSGSFSQIDVGGNLNLNSGIAHFTFTNGFAASTGNSFDFISTNGYGWVNTPMTSFALTGVADGFQASLSGGSYGAILTALNNATAEADTTLLFGSSRDDTFDSGAGNDVLDGGGGNDWLSGGDGNDTFVFGGNDGNDTYTDFDVLTDLLALEDGAAISSITDSDVDGDGVLDAVVDLGLDGSITLLGVNGVDQNDLLI